ncbi:MAG: hypothetical protein ALAOOOJD_03407 [bacterium]|nr:hypothetical protein [bacterium]
MAKILLRTLVYGSLLLLALSMLVPFLWMAATAFMDDLEVYRFPPQLIPQQWRWSNFTEALTLLPFDRFFFNTLIVAFGAVLGQLATCSLAAYAFARMNFKGREKIFALYLGTMMIPAIVTLIPAFLIINALGWMNTYWGLVTPALTSVWGIFLLRQFFLTIPRDYEDVARLDGASEFIIFWKIILPLSKPALATLAIFAFMGSWKDFLWPLIVTSRNDMRTVEVGIAMFHSLHATNWPYQMAAAIVVMLPIVIVFFSGAKIFYPWHYADRIKRMKF